MPGGDELDFGAQSTVEALGETMRPEAAQPARELDANPARFEVRGELGRGGMGRVDRVWDADLMRTIAVKHLREELRGDARLMRQFLWEARVTASLDHPNIVPVHDLGVTTSGRVYFSMKHVQGTPLSDANIPRALRLPRRLRLFLQVCNAVAFAHSRGVLHRDLKPQNIMLGEHGEVVVMDWGLAMPLVGAADVPAPPPARDEQSVSGTPLYMAPEQAAGRHDELDERADVFSLGVILYELSTGKCPYSGTTVSEILEQVRAGRSIPIAEAAPELSPSLRAIIERAMETDPSDRYGSVRELQEDVERALDGVTPEAEEASLARRLGRLYMHRNRRFANLRVFDIDMLVLGCILAGAGLGSLFVRFAASWAWLFVGIGALLCLPFLRSWLQA